MAKIIDEASALSLVGTRSQGVRVRLRIDADTPAAYIDKVQIQQVLFNLMRNAIEAMADSTRREVEIFAARSDGDMVEVRVADTGPGLSAQVRARLFQPCVTTKPDGLGVGLSICRSIIESHGGQLSAEDNREGGTVFRFTLPASAPISETVDPDQGTCRGSAHNDADRAQPFTGPS